METVKTFLKPIIDLQGTGAQIKKLRKINGFTVHELQEIFGNETFDESKVTGRTVRKTPEQKALRFKFYIAGLFIVILLIGIVIKSCSY